MIPSDLGQTMSKGGWAETELSDPVLIIAQVFVYKSAVSRVYIDGD